MYNYETEKKHIFTEDGQEMFLSIRDNVHRILKLAGAITMGTAMSCGKVTCGTTWEMMACVDRLVELEEIVEIKQGVVAGQHRIFIKTP